MEHLYVRIAGAEPGDRVLSLGAQGEDVVNLQQDLTALGYLVPATGYFGTLARRAVAAFQDEEGLPITGKADAATVQQLNGRLGMSRRLGWLWQHDGLWRVWHNGLVVGSHNPNYSGSWSECIALASGSPRES